MTYNYRSEEDLRELYIEKDHTQAEMAEILGVSVSTVSEWMDRHGIETGNRKWSDVTDEDVMAVYDESKTFTDMAHGTKFTKEQIRHAAIKQGIYEPDKEHNIRYTDEELLEQIEDVQSEHGFVSKRLFESLDWTASVTAIRDHFGSWLNGVKVSSVKVSDHQIESSSTPQTTQPRNYDKPRGSQSKYRNKRRKALERDNYTCVICNKESDSENKLHTHHIQPVSNFNDPNDAHTVDNLITLCKEHHNQVHANNIECPDPPEP